MAAKVAVSTLTRKVDAREKAIEEALAKDDFASALDVIAVAWPDFAALQGAALRLYVNAIPRREWEGNAWIITALGASCRSMDSPGNSAGLAYFQLAEQLIESGLSPVCDLPAIQLQHAAYLRSLGMLESARLKVDSALVLLHGNLQLGFPLRFALQSQASLQLGLIEMHLGNFTVAARHLHLSIGLSEHNLVRADRLECLAGLAFAAYVMGDFDRAERLISEASELAMDTGMLDTRFGAAALVAEALIAVDRNQATSARALESRLAAAAHNSEWEPLAFYARSATAGINGQLIEALDLQRRSLAATRGWEGSPAIRTMAETLHGGLRLHLGDPDEAMSVLSRVSPSDDHSSCPAALVASIRYGATDFHGCLDALRGCHDIAEHHSSRTFVDVLLMTAAANYELGNPLRADVAFDRALYLGSQTGTRTPFLVLPLIALLRMLGRAADRYQPDAVHRLLDELRRSNDRHAEVVEPLSDRELDIAHHLFHDKTVGQIAAELFISTNTVKTHVRSIYRKLSATSRKEAIRRVHELGIDVKITPR